MSEHWRLTIAGKAIGEYETKDIAVQTMRSYLSAHGMRFLRLATGEYEVFTSGSDVPVSHASIINEEVPTVNIAARDLRLGDRLSDDSIVDDDEER